MNATDAANLAPYGNGTLPAGIRSRVVNNNNGLMVHVLEAGFETAGRPCALLLHGFPELAYSWRKVMLPLAKAGYHVDRPRPARLWAHHGLGRLLRRRWRSLPQRQHGAGCDGTRLRARLPLGGGRRRPRCGLAGGVVVRGDPPRRLPQTCADELAVPRPAEDELRHRQRRGAGAAALHRRPARRRARQAQPAAQVLSQPPAHARRQRRHAARPAGLARFLSRLLPRQERRLERQHAASAEVAHRRGNGEDAALLRDAEGQGHGRQRRAVHADQGARSPPANG